MDEVTQVDLEDRLEAPRTPPPAHESAGGLAPMEAAVLIHLQAGATTVARLTLALAVAGDRIRPALGKLAKRGYATRVQGQRWHVTEIGMTVRVAQPEPAALPLIARAGRTPHRGSATVRMLDHLDRPRRGPDLARRLGVTRQRVRQVIERLHAEGHIRVADPDNPTYAVARRNDPTVLLTGDEERVLSTIPEAGVVTAGRVGPICGRRVPDTAAILKRLCRYGLVAAHSRKEATMYALTDPGKQHWQRDGERRKARPSPPFRSKRIYLVLRYMAEHEPTRAPDVAVALHTPRQATNALFQYLKRKSLAYREGRQQHHGYRLTDYGRRVLDELHEYWRYVGSNELVFERDGF